jgi:hypothetical protein
MPAAAVAEANHVIGATAGSWRPVLDPGQVIVTPLDQSTAIDTRQSIGSLGTRHVLREARSIRGVIVTSSPGSTRPFLNHAANLLARRDLNGSEDPPTGLNGW